MNCDQVAEKLLVPPDDLSEQERSEVAEHVTECSTCRQMSEELAGIDRAVADGLENLAMQAPDWPDLEAEVMSRIVQTRSRRSVWLWTSGALAASLLVAVGLWAAFVVGGLHAENRSLRSALAGEQAQRVRSEAALTAANQRADTLQKQVVVLEREKARAGTGIVVYQLFEQSPSEPRDRGVKPVSSAQWRRALMNGELKLLIENGGA